MNIGSLVRRKMYQGVQGTIHSPSYYGFVTSILKNGLCDVVFVLRDGSLFNKRLSYTDLVLISDGTVKNTEKNFEALGSTALDSENKL